MRPIDLRSDTVTQPSPEMRAAMASAEVGDDVLERDPTLARLEERVAGLLGLEAALWVPSGCMGNLIGLMLHLKRGDRFLAPAQAHVLGSELGTAAWLAGGMPEALAWEGGPGRPTPAQVTRAAGAPGPYYTLRTTLLCLENTHNFAGGTVTSQPEHRALVAAAKAAHLAVHLDGARLWHAATALGLAPAALAEGVDTVQVCLSKGLGAPMGSLLAGTRPAMAEARRLRKMLGGGVRQGGVVGAAGLQALDYLPRLAEDHAKTQRLAEGLRGFGVAAPVPETNILLVPVPEVQPALAALEAVGVRALPVGSAIRFIAHRDLSVTDIEEALRRLEPLAPVLARRLNMRKILVASAALLAAALATGGYLLYQDGLVPVPLADGAELFVPAKPGPGEDQARVEAVMPPGPALDAFLASQSALPLIQARPEGGWTGVLARDLSLSRNGRRLRFSLCPGWRLQDGGVLDPSKVKSFWAPLEGKGGFQARVVDSATLEVRFAERRPGGLAWLAGWQLPGTGPFRQSGTTLTRFDGFIYGKAGLAEIRIQTDPALRESRAWAEGLGTGRWAWALFPGGVAPEDMARVRLAPYDELRMKGGTVWFVSRRMRRLRPRAEDWPGTRLFGVWKGGMDLPYDPLGL